MKVCIVTVYNSENCGSYWQARALQEFLEARGVTVSFLRRDMKGSSHTILSLSKSILRNVTCGNIRSAIGFVRQYISFEKETKRFQTVLQCGEEFDLCILGSDTIWNLDSNYFTRLLKVYWGDVSHAKRTISYAASIANTTEATIAGCSDALRCLNALDAIGVRDCYTKDTIGKLADRKVELVCDPTMLFSKNYYLQRSDRKFQNRYVLVYYFQKMPEKLQAAVRQFAGLNHYDIIVMGWSMKGDKNLYYSPQVFINCFAYAEFVVTNTFHGTIFSLLLEKQAVFNSDGKKKVGDLLDRFYVFDHDYYRNQQADELFASKRIDYGTVNEHIEEFRRSSRTFLLDILKEEN